MYELLKNIKALLFVSVPVPFCIVLSACLCIGVLTADIVCNHRAKNLSDGERVQPVSEQLERAGENQRELTKIVDHVESGITDSQQEAADIAESTKRAEQSVSDAEKQNDRAGEIIADSQRILERVRKRAEEDKAKD